MALTLAKLCKYTEKTYDITLVAGRDGMENTVRWVHMVEDTQVPDFLHGNELVFTTGIANHRSDWLLSFVQKLKENNASGVVINLGPYIESIPPQVIVYCEQNGFPLFTIPWKTRIVDISYSFCRFIINDEKQEQSLTEAFKNLILTPDDKKGYHTTLRKVGFLENSTYTVIMAEFFEQKKDVTTSFLRKHETQITKLFKLNSLAKSMFFWNKKLVLIYQDINPTLIATLTQRLTRFCDDVQNVQMHLGISNQGIGYHAISDLYFQSKSALQIAHMKRKSAVHYNQIGVYQILLDVDQEVLQEYYLKNFEPLIRHDTAHQSDLCLTLRRYCENNGSVNDMAEFYGVHRNTVNYKMKKIKEILGIELTYQNIMDMMLGFAISDIFNEGE